jgi:hypothetical protein
MGNKETDVGMSCETYGKYISAYKIKVRFSKYVLK